MGDAHTTVGDSPGVGVTRAVVDLRDPLEAAQAVRIARAWAELRRGAAAATLRDYLYGFGDDALVSDRMDTLDVLLSRRRWRMTELAAALRVDPSTATRAIDRLVNDGLAVRRRCDDDGRVVQVEASAEGRRRHRAVARRRITAMSRLLGAFDADERRLLADLLGRLVDELGVLVDQLVDETGGDGRSTTTAG